MDAKELEILNLWKDLSFPGSFRGVKTFQALLKTDKNIDISEKQLTQILKKEPNFVIHQIKPFKPSYRQYVTHNYGQLVQADIAYVFPDSINKAKYFLLLIDVFSSKIFVEVLKDKSSESTANALLQIFKRFGSPIYEIQTDKGKEFTGNASKVLFQKYRVLFRTKRGLNKASICESAIKRVKRKLYLFLRTHLTQHWTKYIQQVCDSINQIPLKRIGFLRPESIKDETGSVEVENSLKSHNLPIPKEPTFQTQIENSKKYEKEAQQNVKLLKVGDFVYKNLNESLFSKSFDIQECISCPKSCKACSLSKSYKIYKIVYLLTIL